MALEKYSDRMKADSAWSGEQVQLDEHGVYENCKTHIQVHIEFEHFGQGMSVEVISEQGTEKIGRPEMGSANLQGERGKH